MNSKILDKIKILKGDITNQKVDAIVNAANKSLLGGGGVDGTIHRVAGSNLLEECKILGGCNTSEAKITKGYNLPAKFVIHTVGPVWHGGKNQEPKELADCYKNSLELAAKRGIKTIVFPSISTGAYGYPIEKAAKIALERTKQFLEKDDNIKKVVFVLFSDYDFEIYQEMIKNLF